MSVLLASLAMAASARALAQEIVVDAGEVRIPVRFNDEPAEAPAAGQP